MAVKCEHCRLPYKGRFQYLCDDCMRHWLNGYLPVRRRMDKPKPHIQKPIKPKPTPEELFARYLKNTYGISLDEYRAMREEQGEQCAICYSTPKKLFVDHDHGTGTVRGLLCVTCNTMLGFARDSESILRNSIAYLSKA